MATAIVSIAAQKYGLHVISLALLSVALIAFVPLAAIDALRVVRPGAASLVLRRASAPGVGLPALGFVADTAVLGTRVALLGGEAARAVAAVLLGIGALVWLPILARVLPPLVHGISGDLVAPARGEWLLGVVSTEGLAVLMGVLVSHPDSALHLAAAVLWLLGGSLYVLIWWLLAARVRRYSVSPEEFRPDVWIVMGGLAIFSVAGATSFHGSPGSAAGALVIGGWGLASAWIPPLALGEVWRIARLGRPRFSPERWTMVFPLGMYSVCGVATGHAFGVAWISDIGHWWFPVALAAWVAVAVGEVRDAFRVERPG